MNPVIKTSDLSAMIGKSVPPSDWFEMTQERVNDFADATLDHQFIHVDTEKAAQTPFGGTIAHGYLTLSMLSHLLAKSAVNLEGQVMSINYGSDKVRYINPVRVGSRIRAHRKLVDAIEKNPGQWLLKSEVTIEIEHSDKPAMIAEVLVLLIVA